MDEEEFIETVRREAPLDSKDEARDVTEATLVTLGERITDGEASDLARDLPDAFAGPLVEDPPGEAEPFPLEEFTARVSERADVAEDDAVAYGEAVATAVSEASGDELEAAREQLDPEYDVIFEPGGPATADEFLETVAERAGVDSRSAAETATEATLETLGERLTGGQAADLAHYLPDDLAPALDRPDDEDARDLSFDEFVTRVARREGVEEASARVHAHAVGSALADAASEREVDAARKQLPDPFGAVFDRPSDVDGAD